jgi:hypothetical protein
MRTKLKLSASVEKVRRQRVLLSALSALCYLEGAVVYLDFVCICVAGMSMERSASIFERVCHAYELNGELLQSREPPMPINLKAETNIF